MRILQHLGELAACRQACQQRRVGIAAWAGFGPDPFREAGRDGDVEVCRPDR